MNEMENAAAGLLYDANYDPDLVRQREAVKVELFEFNHTSPGDRAKRESILRALLGKTGENFLFEGTLHVRIVVAPPSFDEGQWRAVTVGR